ncbi:MAG: ATP-binding protein, partial [Alteraurantiacibacter sp.]
MSGVEAQFHGINTGQSGAFVGCPGDVDHFHDRIRSIYENLLIPGGRLKLYHWRKSFDPGAVASAENAQYLIERTSRPGMSPVFILFGHSVGTPLRPPKGGWGGMRAWLDQNGYGFISLLGTGGFEDIATVPEGTVPLTGTVFELIDVLMAQDDTDLRVVDLRSLAGPPEDAEQAVWANQLLASFAKSQSLIAPTTDEAFDREVRTALKSAFGVGPLDPRRDTLPGLLSLSENSPLLFGRADSTDRLGSRVFTAHAPLTIVTGISGTGKSSLLRAGLMRDSFRHQPDGRGTTAKAHGLLLEPDELRQSGGDPLEVLARVLLGHEDPSERAIGPLPASWSADLPTLPQATGELAQDLPAALDWWAALTASLAGPFVLVLDQAEQIDAAARREAERTGGEPVLEPEWLRFTGLMAALTGTLDPATVGHDPALPQRVTSAGDHGDLRLLLSIHRMSALDLWPLSPIAPANVFDVPPLRELNDWRQLIRGTIEAYGLTIESALLEAMADEATALAKPHPHDGPQDQLSMPVTLGDDAEAPAASVLPQVATAMGRMLAAWRERHGQEDAPAVSAMTLGAEGYAPLSVVGGAIEALGEVAWTAWQQDVASDTGTNVAGYFGRGSVEEEQGRRFAQLLARLVDARRQKRRLVLDLAYLGKAHPVAREREKLVRALRDNRLLTSSNPREGKGFLRLPHRSILDHWPRARAWVNEARTLLDTKGRLVAAYDNETDPGDWSDEQVEVFTRLCLSWIGTEAGEDAAVKAYAQDGLITHLDPERVAPDAERMVDRLPFLVLGGKDERFAEALVMRAAQARNLDVLGTLLIALSEAGAAALAAPLLSGMADPNYIDHGTG